MRRKYSSIGYFCELLKDKCGCNIPLSLLNPRVVDERGVITNIPLDVLLKTGGISEILQPRDVFVHRIGTLTVYDTDIEPDSIEKECDISVENILRSSFPLGFGVYEVFTQEKYRDSLVCDIKRYLLSFDVDRNTSESPLEYVLRD